MSGETLAPAARPSRIPSMDQYRGFAIFGMLLVDYFGAFDAAWGQLHHHRETFTFADSIAPIFMFVVGMGMRLSMKKRAEKVGVPQARKELLKRYFLLLLIAFTIYTGYLWDALINIALASLIAVFVVDRKPAARLLTAAGFLLLYQFIFSFTSYGGWLLREVSFTEETLPLIWKLIPIGPTLMDCAINGGPLGHWSWLMMLIAGTIGYDLLATKDTRKITMGALGLGAIFLIIGYGVHCPWPGIKEEWPFSKYYMTMPMALWSTGICFVAMLVFHLLCDVMKIRIPHLTVLGMNPLFIYILQWGIMESAHRFLPGDTTNWTGIMGGFLIFYGICYGTAYYLHRKNIFIKL